MRISPALVAVFSLLALPGFSSAQEGNARKGKRLFAAQCAACHADTEENRATGPGLANLAGRRAGTREGFAFSEALKKSGLVWGDATLEKYLENPTTAVPGTTMTIAVSAAASRADLIAYVNTLSVPAPK